MRRLESFYSQNHDLQDVAVSCCEALYETTRDWIKDRKAFGKTLHKLQTIKHRMAEMKTEISIARSFVDNCIDLHSQGRLDSQSASMAKYWCTDLQNKVRTNLISLFGSVCTIFFSLQVAAECVQLHGGMGYMSEHPVCRAYIDSRVQTIYGGSNEIMKELISRTL